MKFWNTGQATLVDPNTSFGPLLISFETHLEQRQSCKTLNNVSVHCRPQEFYLPHLLPKNNNCQPFPSNRFYWIELDIAKLLSTPVDEPTPQKKKVLDHLLSSLNFW